jgi:hypothetical protein
MILMAAKGKSTKRNDRPQTPNPVAVITFVMLDW